MPGLFEQFPHTNLHELNLDWLINMINQFKEELENSAVLSVNGETGHVTLYESENVILPALPSGVDQWRLVRLMGGQYVGILFYNGHAYIQRGNENMRLLTLKDIPTSSGVVSWNGLTGVVNVTGANIPVDDSADADSIDQAITTEHTERVNADNALSNSINAANQAITTLNSKIRPSADSWYEELEYSTVNTSFTNVVKTGNIVSVNISITVNSLSGHNPSRLLLLKEGYKPTYYNNFMLCRDETSATVVDCAVMTNGYFCIYGPVVGHRYSFYGAYIV